MAEITLYSYYRSSASYRVRIALELKQIPYEYKAVHLLEGGGQQYKPEYKKLNPAHEVPTLVHNSNALGQSMAILEYLDSVFPQSPLFPQDPVLAAKVRQFCETINCLQPLQNLRTLQFLTNDLAMTDEQKQRWLNRWMSKAFEALELQIEKFKGNYCFGSEITAADCFLVPQLFAANRFGVDLEPYPHLLKIAEDLEKLDAFKKAHPANQPDTPKSS